MGLSPKYNDLGLGRDMAWYACPWELLVNTCVVLTKVALSKICLNPSKALGPDELHPRVLKELTSELGPVFAHLFQQSIDTVEIPKEWSLANICPLF